MSIFNIDSKDIVFNPGTDGPNSKHFIPVPIPGDFIADNKIFPGRVLSGYHAPFDPKLPWGSYMLSLAQEKLGVTGVSWFAGLNSGSTGGQYWFGYLFGGGPIDSSDFVEAPKNADVTLAQAYTIVLTK